MKKTLLIISLTLFTLTLVNAQKKNNFGVKGGINFSNMTSDYYLESDSKTEFHIGLVAEIPIVNKFSIQTEILYSEQGTKSKVELLGGNPSLVEYNLNYLQVPVLAKIYLFQNLSIEVGPSFNFLVKDEEIFEYTTLTNVGSNFEFSGVLGVSYKVRGGFFGTLRYLNGFTVALDRELRDEDAKNRVFQLGIGYMF